MQPRRRINTNGLSDRKFQHRAGVAAPERAVREPAPQLYNIVVANELRTATALQAFACREASAGRPRLAELCTKNAQKLASIVAGAWAVADAPRRLADENMSLMDKLRRAAAESPCVCAGAWRAGAERSLSLNEIPVMDFCRAICRALEFGARRGVNVACIGTGGCGKSTLLESLEFIFQTLGKPEDGSTFPLGNLPSCDIMLWQDYEHSEATVKFTDLLSLLVGESMELRAPGVLNTKFRNKAPLFYSGRVPLQCVRRNPKAAASLNSMMSERFVTFTFETPLPQAERLVDWKHCAKCCAAFFLQGAHSTAAAAVEAPGAERPAVVPTEARPTGAADVAFGQAAAPAVAHSHGDGLPSDVAPADLLSRAAAADRIVSGMQGLYSLYSAGVLDKPQFEHAKRSLLGM